MKKWMDYFFSSVSQPALLSAAGRLHCPEKREFSKQLETLKKNVITSKFIDPYEFYDLTWDNILKGGQKKHLDKIKSGLDRLAEIPIGRQIISSVCPSTYFSTIEFDVLGRFYISDCQYIFLNPVPKIFRSTNRVAGILIHEMTHAKNAQMFGEACGYRLPPRLFFMQRIMNEMTARFSECVMSAQLKNKNAQQADILTNEVLYETYDTIVSKEYLPDFTNDTIRRYRQQVMKKESLLISDCHLKPFAYYFMFYPVLKNREFIESMYRLYNRHVVRKVVADKKVIVNTDRQKRHEKE
ncbi:MAG: hypothetical protein IKY98_04715 [Alphaproteobacteria bacterium]|nr:hypothetical protein [Alphaproteobacteria bacterium]